MAARSKTSVKSLQEPRLVVGGDLLRGAGEISTFLFGEPRDRRQAANNRQRAYNAIARGSIPTFRLGGMIHARKSAILRHIEEQERGGEGAP